MSGDLLELVAAFDAKLNISLGGGFDDGLKLFLDSVQILGSEFGAFSHGLKLGLDITPRKKLAMLCPLAELRCDFGQGDSAKVEDDGLSV